ncbi:uncharacterized protein BP01DRAFT_396585 [Aspergillus saccharolyticus JOP 1030-1]|uniref:Uncharacterized protein n=1 Tax=Aspergillus saccharolyticus JOP 1030-1 TaxID=1450539 RepID=A0A319AV12_9EURO|nr:hypothetical protein BP01DRAFT_396585 [Aspergillus saccharolyticus JOP 1030-1]PYH49902.1 hypothetical protein BP01DRAFT_396585 [Aspergillus saccharolyticus JOP 1030-1]
MPTQRRKPHSHQDAATTRRHKYHLRSKGPVGPGTFQTREKLTPRRLSKRESYSFRVGIRLRLAPRRPARPDDVTSTNSGSWESSSQRSDAACRPYGADENENGDGTSFYVEQVVYQSLPHREGPIVVNAEVEVLDRVPIEAMIDAKYIPSDEDPEFQRRADDWQDPAIAHAIGNCSPRAEEASSQQADLTDFFEAVRSDRYRNHTDARMFLFMWILLRGFPSQQNGEISFLGDCYIPLWREHAHRNEGVYFEYYIARWKFFNGEELISPPFAICTCNHGDGRVGIARYEIPALLLQANMNAKLGTEHLKHLTAYVLSLQGWNLRFLKATMPVRDAQRLSIPEYLSGKIKVE